MPPTLRSRARLAAALAAVALAASACATPGPLPPITEAPSGAVLPGKFVWFDLLSEDVDAARLFYGHVFGWTFQDFDEDGEYKLIRNGSVPIAGLAPVEERDSEAPESFWLATLSVLDVDWAARVVKHRGGEILVEPVDVPGRGRLAAVRDPQGAALVLLRAAGGDPPDGIHAMGDWLWTDYWTHDAGAAQAFYRELVRYESKDIEVGKDHTYRVFGRDGRARAGLVELTLEGVDPNWLPYVRVDDVSGAARRAQERGGKVLLLRDDVAVLLDPTGAAIGVQRRGAEGVGSGS